MFNFKGVEKIKSDSIIKLLDTNIQCSQGYLLINGFFINKSDYDIAHIVAVAKCYSAGGSFVKKADILVDDMIIKPNQVSSFSIAMPDQTHIYDVKISFKKLFGQEIETIGRNYFPKPNPQDPLRTEGVDEVPSSLSALLNYY